MPRSKSGTGVHLHWRSCGQFYIRSRGTSLHPPVSCSVSFLPGEIHGTTYAYVWCSLSPFRGGSCQDADPPLLRDSSNKEDNSVNLPARRSGAKPSASVCLPFAILPNQTCFIAAYHATNHSTTTPQLSPEEASPTVAYASTTAWVSGRKKTGLGLEGAIKLLQAPPINVPITPSQVRRQEPDNPASD